MDRSKEVLTYYIKGPAISGYSGLVGEIDAGRPVFFDNQVLSPGIISNMKFRTVINGLLTHRFALALTEKNP